MLSDRAFYPLYFIFLSTFVVDLLSIDRLFHILFVLHSAISQYKVNVIAMASSIISRSRLNLKIGIPCVSLMEVTSKF